MLSIDDSILKIKGIGPQKSKKFSNLGIFSIKDLMYYFPRNYENRSNIKEINHTPKDDNKITILAKVCGHTEEIRTRKKKRILKVPVIDESGKATVIFYNSPYLKKAFPINRWFYFYGKVNIINNTIQIIHPEYSKYDNSENFTKVTPIYGLTSGLTQKDINNIQEKILLKESIKIDEYMPEKILKKNKLCNINYALKNIHFPSSQRALRVSKYRLIFEELFFLQMALLLLKSKNISCEAGIKYSVLKEFNSLLENLPFKLTKAQTRVLNEIIDDMKANKVMNRLIQGDVGSGKTIIALLAMYLAVINGYQSALMAPTEILAEQHMESFNSLLTPLGIKIGLLSSSSNNKLQTLEKIKQGDFDIIIGTHALIQEKVEFSNLGLVVTDEQHRFGVRQRSFLSQKGMKSDILVMTATPIPRTLSLILYGDLDISIIDELPPGRKAIKTYSINNNKIIKMYDFISKEVDKGRQAYIVCPLIEESDKIDCQSATELFSYLNKTFFKTYKLGIIHGKMSAINKEETMKEFEKGNIQILITTTVIEVGINVPNATIMAIQNAERFGLAQLHQLRGRVGRGEHQSYCFLINNSNSGISKERMNIMESTNNGFLIAEKDLELRGPGDFFGTKQHGIPELKIANLFKHSDILKKAQDQALEIIKKDNTLSLKENKNILLKLKNDFNIFTDDFTI